MMLRPRSAMARISRLPGKGCTITDPPLTRWVCAADPFVCRLHHHRPTSHEVGMESFRAADRENLTRTRSGLQLC